MPIVITGFEPIDMLEGILRTVRQLEAGEAEVENQYSRAVRPEGNPAAKKLIEDVFEVCDRKWRGVGLISRRAATSCARNTAITTPSGIFEVEDIETQESKVCISGQILQRPEETARLPRIRQAMHAANTRWGPRWFPPEGACAAYYAYGRHLAANGSIHAIGSREAVM